MTAPAAAGPNAARRRLMLGAGAIVPSVLTLSSGAAIAAASSTHCLNTAAGTPPQRFTGSQDKWFRAQVYDGKATGKSAHCVTTPQTTCTDGNGGGQPGSIWVKDDGSRMMAGPGNDVKNVTSAPKSYGLVYVDQQGTVNTLDPNGNPALSYASIACYNSVLGTRISKLG
ncbi:MAG: hypothetical protein ABI812_10920 [Betaproteobacteria bacterium]